MTFLVGEHNEMLVPEGTRRSADLLRQVNDPALTEWVQVPGYGHLDCLVGRSARADVFPLIDTGLERSTV